MDELSELSARTACVMMQIGVMAVGSRVFLANARAVRIRLRRRFPNTLLTIARGGVLTVVQAFGTVRNAEARQRSATAAFFPSLSLNSGLGRSFSEGPQRVDPNTGQVISGNSTNQSITNSISSNVDLFTGFRRGNEKKAATANRGAAEASLANALNTQQLATTNQFFDVLAAQELLRVREASVRRAEEQLRSPWHCSTLGGESGPIPCARW
jgi:outer membrane protein TolC